MPLGDNTATSGECYNFFASVGRAGYVNIGNYGTSYPKGCWYQGTTRYFNTYTGTSGSGSSATAICRMPSYYEGAMNTDCATEQNPGTAMTGAEQTAGDCSAFCTSRGRTFGYANNWGTSRPTGCWTHYPGSGTCYFNSGAGAAISHSAPICHRPAGCVPSANPAQCGTSSPVQWTLGDQGDNCVGACSYIGLSCDQNALNAQGHRNTGCIQALADDLGGTCNSVVHNTWSGRPALEMGSSSCYYASSNGNSLCATIGSTNRRFCPCSYPP
eukprot:scaffold94539_cov60-Phaeocystis_antarctica.AAC.1